MDMTSALALGLGSAWASGINLYMTALIIGGLGAAGVVDLPPDLQVLQSPTVLVAAVVLYAIEFLADKIPGVDSLNDMVHTFIRIPAGALLAMGSVSDISEPWQAVAALVLGGLVSAGSHAAKTGTRALINTTPEPFSNWFASIFEDVIVLVGLLLALFKPVLFLAWMAAFALFLLWLLPKLWRGLKMIWQRLQTFRETGRAAEGGGRSMVSSLVGPPAASGSGDQPPAPRP